MSITAEMVKALREKTGLPMMECKKALTEAGGDEAKAIEILRERGLAKMQKMASREAAEGCIFCWRDPETGNAGIVELRCETAPVAANEQFLGLAKAIAQRAALIENPSAETIRAEPLVDDPARTVGDLMDEVFNRIRENMKIARVGRLSGHTGHYVHHTGKVGVLVEMSEACDDEVKSDICMHIAAMNPPCLTREDADPAEVERQRATFAEEAKGKPEHIAAKIVDGKMNRWYSEFVLLEQPYVKDDKQSVGQYLKSISPSLTIKRFVRFEVGAS